MEIIQSSPILESKTRTGKNKYWQGHVYQDGTRFFTGTEYWQTTKAGIKSKVTFSEPYEALPKNVGKANETSAKDQAISEFSSFVQKQRDKGYGGEGEPTESDPLPMLAHRFADRKKNLDYPVYTQPKLDGMRMLFDGQRGWSRGNKAILSEVIEHLVLVGNFFFDGEYIIDGELILPGNKPLQETMSAAKKFRSGISDTLQYWVYDIVAPDKTYVERKKLLETLHKDWNNPNVILTPTLECSDETAVRASHEEYVASGYEGTIIRDPQGKYEIGHRSPSLLKLKDFQDGEFKIVGFKQGSGSFSNSIIFTCEAENGNTFDVLPEGTMEHRAELWNRRDEFLHKFLTVRYQTLTNDKVPQFPIGVTIRDIADFEGPPIKGVPMKKTDIVERYENHTEGHDKFWELRTTVNGFEATWGKCGGTAQGPKIYDRVAADKVILQKLKKGYQWVTTGIGIL